MGIRTCIRDRTATAALVFVVALIGGTQAEAQAPCSTYSVPSAVEYMRGGGPANFDFLAKNINQADPFLGLTGLISIATIVTPDGRSFPSNTLFLFPGWNRPGPAPVFTWACLPPGKKQAVIYFHQGSTLHRQFSDLLGQPPDSLNFIGISASLSGGHVTIGFNSDTFNKHFFGDRGVPDGSTCSGTAWRQVIDHAVQQAAAVARALAASGEEPPCI